MFVYWFVQAFFVYWFVKKFYLTSKLIKVNYTLCFSKILWAILSKFYRVKPFVSNFTFHTPSKHQKSLRNHVFRGYRLGHTGDTVSRVRLNTHLHLFRRALTAMGDFLLGVLQQMTFIYYLTESSTCFKFSLWKPKHLSFKNIFVANLIFIGFLFIWLPI